jgi:hypothetical protein
MSSDFGLAKIAEHFGKQEAVALFREAAALEEADDIDGSIKLYRRAFKLWDALDSTLESGLPRAVRREAEAAGIDCQALAGESMETEQSLRFDISETADWMAHLDEHGYCVIAQVADAEAVEKAKSLMWDFLENAPGSKVKRDDSLTWGTCDWLPSSQNGILGSHGFGQSEFCWHTRLLPAVKQIFAAIWGCDDLIVSFDGGNIFRPWAQQPEWRTEGSWWHVDQNVSLPGKQTRVSVQGLVTFTDAHPGTGGLCVIPGSHKQHQSVCERACSDKLSGNFVLIQPGDPCLETGARLVCAKAGDLVLWDSRCIHCNTPGIQHQPTESADSGADPKLEFATMPIEANAQLLRVVGYVCMTPASWATQDVLSKRKVAFLENMTLDHWPHEVHDLGPSCPPSNKWSDASDMQKHMVVGASSSLMKEL